MDIDEHERHKIESVIRNFKEIKTLKKSKKKEITTEIVITAINVVIGGIVISNNTLSVASVAALGSISGILTWLRHNLPSRLK
jgi:hypothetical protein